jgi:hypothetical protein
MEDTVTTTTDRLAKLYADRRLVRIAVAAGVAISLAANAAGSTTVVNALYAAWPPISLLFVLEILPRTPLGRWHSTAGRVLATLCVAAAAGWLSYSHMAASAAAHGEHGVNAYVWPISVDGLMTVAAIALVEIGARVRQLEAVVPVKSEVSDEQRTRRSEAARKAAATRKANKAAAEQAERRAARQARRTERQQLEVAYAAPAAPVSPAPYGS